MSNAVGTTGSPEHTGRAHQGVNEFFSRGNFSPRKTRRILIRMGVDLELFQSLYTSEIHKGGGRGTKTVSDVQLAAVKQFMRDRNLKQLMNTVGARSENGAHAIVIRCLRQGLV